MRPIRWLHLSDFHLRASQKWSQDVVLRAMCQHIQQQRQAGAEADFIVVTGDIAFSGKAEEYAQAGSLFADIQSASGVPLERIFCVPGNHDIDRTRHDLCFRGARAELSSQNQVDSLLAGGEDVEVLLARQENYRRFQNALFAGQNRTWTEDGLGYMCRIAIEEVELAIVGLDSAWLAEGGIGDHGNLLIGERQVINAIELATAGDASPHVILGMAHHPLHLLQEFDRLPVQNRVEETFHFYHCGHLHHPETRIAGATRASCLTVAAGASYETRQSRNAYSVVRLDLLRGIRTVDVFQYNPAGGTFSHAKSNEYPIEASPSTLCSVLELAQAILAYSPALADVAFYLATLVLGKKSEVPIPAQDGLITFGSVDAMQDSNDGDFKCKTNGFMMFRNILLVLSNRIPLPELLGKYGLVVEEYGKVLVDLCKSDSRLRGRVMEYEEDARTLARVEPNDPFSHTVSLFEELAAAQEWRLLRNQAKRHLDSATVSMATQAKRMIALSLANSNELANTCEAIRHYRSLVGSEFTVPSDIGNLAILLTDAQQMDEAIALVVCGIETFPEQASYFFEIGQRIVVETGDRELRERIEDAMREQI